MTSSQSRTIHFGRSTNLIPENVALLSEDQREIFDYYVSGKNIFITGAGGCGKSFLIKTIVEHAKLNNIKIDVCAMTGCAAVLLECGAKTLHSWAGIGTAKGSDDVIVGRIKTDSRKRNNWKRCKVLIVDEVSMMSARLFNLLDQIGKQCRMSGRPFGGIQVIFSGDFYQLPPIGNKDDIESSQFCFESHIWDDTFDYQCILDTPFRQKDKAYLDILQEVRHGKLSSQTVNTLTKLVNRPIAETMEIKPVVLLPTKNAVERINGDEMMKLDVNAEEFVYEYEKGYAPDPEYSSSRNFVYPTEKQLEFEENFMITNGLFESRLVLKVGCQVMCIANLDIENGICNGSTGIVWKFSNGIPIVKFQNGKTMLMTRHTWNSDNILGFFISQIPLVLAWAVTIHKSQGATLETAEIDIGSSVFACGQTYVALSRVRSLDGLYLKSFNPRKIKTNEKVMKFYEKFYDFEDDDDEPNPSREQPHQDENENETQTEQNISTNITPQTQPEETLQSYNEHDGVIPQQVARHAITNQMERNLQHIDTFAYIPQPQPQINSIPQVSSSTQDDVEYEDPN